jgi:large subunit ribosomal protein L17
MIELVDFNEIYGKGKGEEKSTAKKTRRAGSKKKTDATEKTGEETKAAE